MNGYLINFIVYTLAMIGIMLIAVVIYKKVFSFAKPNNLKNEMKIEETLNLSPRKTLYVVNVKNEKFLIASDTDRTSFLAKLENDLPSPTKEFSQPTPQYIPNVDIDEIKRAKLLKQKSNEKIAAAKNLINKNNLPTKKRTNPNNPQFGVTKRGANKSFQDTFEERKASKTPVMRNLVGQIKLKRG